MVSRMNIFNKSWSFDGMNSTEIGLHYLFEGMFGFNETELEQIFLILMKFLSNLNVFVFYPEEVPHATSTEFHKRYQKVISA
jgi:hypothetical protein